MALAKGYNVRYRWQGISLHCWLTTLEMLMDWRYGNIYGNGRNQHTDQVRQAKARTAPEQVPHLFGRWFKAGYSPGYIHGYGLRQVRVRDNTIRSWEVALRENGPILACGKYGPARILGLHCILIIGVSRSNKLVYLDPFLIGNKAIIGNHFSYITPAAAYERLTETYNIQQLYAAERGANDRGFGW